MAQTNIQHIPGKATVTGNLVSSLVGNVTGNITGSVSSATSATYAVTATAATNATYATDAGAADTVAFTDRDSQNETDYIAFVSSHTAGNKALRTDSNLTYNPSSHYLNANVAYANNATNAAGPNGAHQLDTGVVASTIVKRQSHTNVDAPDIAARLFRSTHDNQNTISGGIAHRVSTNDNYIRFCNNMGSVRTFIGAPSRTGGGATGAWNININGAAANAAYAVSAGSSTNATYATDAGSVTHANAANKVAFTDRDANDETTYIAFVDTHAADDKALYTDSNLTYNPANNHITANVPYADMAVNLGGYAMSNAANGNSIVSRTGSAHVYMNYGFSSYLNMSHGTGTRNSDTVFYSSHDNYIRKNTAAGLRASLDAPRRGGGDASGTWSININGTANSGLGQSGSQGWTPAVHITGSANHSHNSWTWKRFHSNGTAHALANFSDNDGDDGFDGDYPPPSSAPTMNATYGFMGSNWIITNEWLLKVSDRRIKDDIVPIETDYALSKVNKLRPVSFIKKDTRQPEYGFIAQEVQEEIPESVSKTTGIVGNICEFGKFSGRRLINEDERRILSKDASGSYSNIYEYTLTTFNPIPDTFDASTTAIFRIDQHNPNRVKNVCIDTLYEPEISGQVYTPPGYGDQSTTIIKLLIGEEDIEGINEQETYRLYGTGVEDMRALGGDSILSMVTASVQEIDKLRLQDQGKITSLEAKCKEVSEILDTLESN